MSALRRFDAVEAADGMVVPGVRNGDARVKQRRKYQRTSAAAISAYLRREGIDVERVHMNMLRDRWVVVVNCKSMMQANTVWVALRKGDYNLLGQYHEWVIVAESQDDAEGVP